MSKRRCGLHSLLLMGNTPGRSLDAPENTPLAKKKPPAPNGPKKLSALAAAARVLQERKQPMRCSDLIEAMTTEGYWTSPSGKTPEATLSAAIQREIALKKDQSRFKKTAPGHYTLA
jgi:hypothetical protein